MADIYTTILYGDGKECPKKDRCKHADNCKHTDTFKGEYICFDRKPCSSYDKRKLEAWSEIINNHRRDNSE